ncbi:MAG: hypothetical protein IJ356_06640 [Erysipelotrichaceae bacterium]|nr:hypothetical protein [Erysipelotrichaceae bacterium]
MKKQYEKPVILFEDFTDYESVYDPRYDEQISTESLSINEIVDLLTK